MRRQPNNMCLRLVNLSVSKRVLLTQRQSQLTEPYVVVNALARPDRARVIGMCLPVRARRENALIDNPMDTIQQLCSFKDHLYDMLVAMMFRSFAVIEVEEEDIHFGGVPFP